MSIDVIAEESTRQQTMPQKVQTLTVRKIDPNSQTDRNLVKIVAESGKFKSINPQNYEDELNDPIRAFYLMEDGQEAPAAIISVVVKDSDYASFTTGRILPIRNAIVTEAGYAFQHGKRYYQVLKQVILYALINSEIGNVLGLPLVTKDQYMVTKVTGPKKANESGEHYVKGSVRPESKSIVDVDKKLGFATVGYSPDHYGPIHVATYKMLREAFSKKANIPPLEIAGNSLVIQVTLDAEGKFNGYAKRPRAKTAELNYASQKALSTIAA